MSDKQPSARDLPPFPSNRLLYRPFALSDAENAFAVFGDAQVMQYSVSGRDLDLGATVARIQRYVGQNVATGFAPWAIVETATECVIGFCGLMRLEGGNDVEIAYRLRRDRWGKGMATEAATAWIDRGFSLLRLSRILAFVDPANTASLRVVAKIGMRFVESCRYEGIPVRKYEITNENAAAFGDVSEVERDSDEQAEAGEARRNAGDGR